MDHRSKTQVNEVLRLGSFKPLVHISGMYATKNNSLAIILPICQHPTNNNGVIVYDLSIEPEPLLNLTIEDIRARIFTSRENLPEGVERVPLKTVHINKCPVLAPMSVIRPQDAERLNLDLNLCIANAKKITDAIHINKKVAEIFNESSYSDSFIDPDTAIYSGGFFSELDKQKFLTIKACNLEELMQLKLSFNDSRLDEMFFRYKGRNYPEALNAKEKTRWKQFCSDRLNGKSSVGVLCFDSYLARLNELKSLEGAPISLINILTDYAQEICAEHSS